MELGAVLAQKDDVGREFVIAFATRSNNNTESNYSSYEGEALAAVWAIAHFRPYLYGQRFTLVTDHQQLKGLWSETSSLASLLDGHCCFQSMTLRLCIEHASIIWMRMDFLVMQVL